MATVVGLRTLAGRLARLADTEALAIADARLQELGEELIRRLREAAPHGEREGADSLSESFHFHTERHEREADMFISTDQPDIFRWVTRGTGIYGPSGQPITPHGSVLRFKWSSPPEDLEMEPDEDGYYYFRHVAGAPPHPFFTDVMAESQSEIDHVLARIGAGIVSDIVGHPVESTR